MNTITKSKKLTPISIKKRITPILKRGGIKRAYLFGSHSRGDATKKSDVDLLIDIPTSYTFFRLTTLKRELSKCLSRPVDVVPRDALSPRLRPYILDELIRMV